MAKYETLLENIKDFLERRRQDNEKKEKLPCLTMEKLKEETGTALEELKHFRSQKCAERIDTILSHELPECAKERLLEIQEQLKLYEDDKAEELLSQLLNILEKEEEGK